MNAPTTSTHVHAHAACAMRGDRDGMAVGGAAEEAEKGGDRRGGEDKLIFLCGAKAEWAMARKSPPWHAPLRPLPVPTAMCAQRELKFDFK